MTSETTPPPSEGPSLDPVIAGQTLAWWVVELLKAWHSQRDLGPILKGIYQAGRAEAHLEDARAGCDWCARRPNAPEKRDGWKGWWHKGKTKGSQRAFFKCERPEVWDALSLLPLIKE